MVSWSLWGSLVGGGVSAVPGNGVPDGVGPGAGAVGGPGSVVPEGRVDEEITIHKQPRRGRGQAQPQEGGPATRRTLPRGAASYQPGPPAAASLGCGCHPLSSGFALDGLVTSSGESATGIRSSSAVLICFTPPV